MTAHPWGYPLHPDPNVWATAVRLVRSRIEPDQAQLFRDDMRDPSMFVARHHMSAGLAIRNVLRHGGITEAQLGVAELDDVWVAILREALVSEDHGPGDSSK